MTEPLPGTETSIAAEKAVEGIFQAIRSGVEIGASKQAKSVILVATSCTGRRFARRLKLRRAQGEAAALRIQESQRRWALKVAKRVIQLDLDGPKQAEVLVIPQF